MTNGYIIGSTETPMSLRAFFSSLTALFPDAEMTGDYYADRQEREIQIAKHCGISSDSPVVESTRNADARLGPATSFVVPLNDSLAFVGRFASRGIMLNASRQFSLAESRRLCDYLRSLGLELEVYCGE